MGGPGIFFSQALLEKLTGGRLLKCLASLKTPHEDVELSRCIEALTGKDCGRSREAGQLFAEDYELRVDKRPTLSKSLLLEQKALTIHPNKHPGNHQWRLGVKWIAKLHSLLFHVNRLESTKSWNEPKAKLNLTYNDGEWISHDTHLDKQYLEQQHGSFRQITPLLKKLNYSGAEKKNGSPVQ